MLPPYLKYMTLELDVYRSRGVAGGAARVLQTRVGYAKMAALATENVLSPPRNEDYTDTPKDQQPPVAACWIAIIRFDSSVWSTRDRSARIGCPLGEEYGLSVQRGSGKACGERTPS
jgi:hypothetical protein